MYKTKIWDKKELFLLADGKQRTMEETIEQFPFLSDPAAVIVLEYISPSRVGAINDLWMLRDMNKISMDISDEEAVQEYIAKRDTPPEDLQEPTAEERIAAALEFQSMMML